MQLAHLGKANYMLGRRAYKVLRGFKELLALMVHKVLLVLELLVIKSYSSQSQHHSHPVLLRNM